MGRFNMKGMKMSKELIDAWTLDGRPMVTERRHVLESRQAAPSRIRKQKELISKLVALVESSDRQEPSTRVRPAPKPARPAAVRSNIPYKTRELVAWLSDRAPWPGDAKTLLESEHVERQQAKAEALARWLRM
jgi:hypothetical protein